MGTEPSPPDPPRSYSLPVWLLPVLGLVACTIAGWYGGVIGAGLAIAVLTAVAVSTVGADAMPHARGRRLAQVGAVFVGGVIVIVAILRGGVTMAGAIPVGVGVLVDLRNQMITQDEIEGLDLRGAQLQGAVLSGTTLRGIDLTDADLSGAFLVGADLAGARLDRADLSGADLRESCLRGSTLLGAVLTGVDADGADTAGAVAEQTAIATARVWPVPGSATGAACTR